MARVLPRNEAPLLHFVYCLALGFGAWALARVVLIAQAHFFLAPEERFPLTLEGYLEAPAYFWPYVRFGAVGLGVATGLFLWSFNAHYANWRVVPFVLKKFFLWWGVGLSIGGLAGWAAYTGDLEPFLNKYLPFIWESKEVTRPGQVVETFLPPMPEDSFRALASIAFQVGVLANAAWFVLRFIYYRIRSEVASLRAEPGDWLIIPLRGHGIQIENY